jgi:hypothetical protein
MVRHGRHVTETSADAQNQSRTTQDRLLPQHSVKAHIHRRFAKATSKIALANFAYASPGLHAGAHRISMMHTIAAGGMVSLITRP